jgi:glycosyltransferase involved in cell wall biosynthesis
MQQPFFSIIMPLYNHSAYVGEAIESVMHQSLEDFELVVCNDGSTDASLEVVQSFKDDRIKVISKPNGGTVSALNACLLKSQGEYICWLSSDDLFTREKLKRHHEFHLQNPDKPLSVGPFGHMQDGVRQHIQQVKVADPSRLLHFVYGNYINGLSVCAHKQLYALYGGFDARYRYAHDVERWFKFFRFVSPNFLEGEALSFSRLGSGGTADADLLGVLDVMKFVANELQARGLKCLIPDEASNAPLTIETVGQLCLQLMNPASLFVQFGMQDYLIPIVARTVIQEKLVDHLNTMMLALESMRADPVLQDVLGYFDQILAMCRTGAEPETTSLVQHLVGLHGRLNPGRNRDIVAKFLRNGF